MSKKIRSEMTANGIKPPGNQVKRRREAERGRRERLRERREREREESGWTQLSSYFFNYLNSFGEMSKSSILHNKHSCVTIDNHYK